MENVHILIDIVQFNGFLMNDYLVSMPIAIDCDNWNKEKQNSYYVKWKFYESSNDINQNYVKEEKQGQPNPDS